MKVTGNPAYGDKYPRFSVDGGGHDVDNLARFLKILFDIGYLGEKTGANGKPPIVGFEVKPLLEESSGVVLASTKRVWRQAWAQLQMGRKTSRHCRPYPTFHLGHAGNLRKLVSNIRNKSWLDEWQPGQGSS